MAGEPAAASSKPCHDNVCMLTDSKKEKEEVMDRFRGIPLYFREYPTILVNFYVNMCIYTYIYKCIML